MKRFGCALWVFYLGLAAPCQAKFELSWPWEWEWKFPEQLKVWKKAPDKEPALYMIVPAGSGTKIVPSTSDEVRKWISRAAANARTTGRGPNLVIVTHGWIERTDWFRDMALAISGNVDPNDWICAYYDWRGQARKLNPTEVAQLGRQTLGPALGRLLVDMPQDWNHVHLIGHSAGVWLISEAGRVIAKETKASIQLTFLDAYIPPFWHQEELADICQDPNHPYWADHYFTSDITLRMTQTPLRYAHNVDLTKVDPGPNSHRFPFHWYTATVAGQFITDGYKGKPLATAMGSIRYGFTRSLEAGQDNWQQSLKLGVGNEPVMILKN